MTANKLGIVEIDKQTKNDNWQADQGFDIVKYHYNFCQTWNDV